METKVRIMIEKTELKREISRSYQEAKSQGGPRRSFSIWRVGHESWTVLYKTVKTIPYWTVSANTSLID